MFPGGELGPTREDDRATRQELVITQTSKRFPITRRNHKSFSVEPLRPH